MNNPNLKDDWRYLGQEKWLANLSFSLKPYMPTEGNDHDHCEFCTTKFSLLIPDALKDGYGTEDNYRWICEPCYHDFKGILNPI